MAPSLDLDVADAGPVDVDVSAFTRIRVLAFAALGSIVTGYVAVATLLALVTAIAPLAHFSTTGVLVAALPAWLAAHQVPLEIDGLELGMLPLLPTAAMILIAARAASGAAERLGLYGPWQAGQAVGTIALAHGGGGLAVALLDSQQVSADPLAAFYYSALIAGLAATVGVLRPCGLWAMFVARTDPVAVCGLRSGAFAVLTLLAAGGAVLTFGLLTSVPTARELFAIAGPGLGDGIGMLLLSIGYVPNAVIAGVAFLAGPGFSMGGVSVSPLDFTGGSVPSVPLLAAMPEEPAAWWPVLFVLPLGVGVLVGRRLADVSTDPFARVRGATVAASVVAVVFVVLAGCAGGRVGVGPFDPASLRAAAVSLMLVLWIGVPAAITAWLSGPRPARADPPGLLEPDNLLPDDPETDDPETDDLKGDDLEPDDPPTNDPLADDPAADDLHSTDRETDRLEADNLAADDLLPDDLPLDGLPVDGLPLDGLPVDGLPVDGLPVDGLLVDGLQSDRLRGDGLRVDGLDANDPDADVPDSDRRGVDRLIADSPDADRLETDRLETDRLDVDRLDVDRLGTDRLDADGSDSDGLDSDDLERTDREGDGKTPT
jgi:hypothetical protein